MTQKPNSKARKGIMWASSHMGPRGFRVSLAQNCCQGRLHQGRFNKHIVLSSMNIVLKLSELRLSTTLPPPPTGREGYYLMWSILGCAAGQDMVLVCP